MANIELTRAEDEAAEISVTGLVDRAAVEALGRMLVHLDHRVASRVLVVDFGLATRLEDVVLAELAEDLRRHPRLQLRGLRDHHLRVLHYLHAELREGSTRTEVTSIEFGP
jgi:hypothetical protein